MLGGISNNTAATPPSRDVGVDRVNRLKTVKLHV